MNVNGIRTSLTAADISELLKANKTQKLVEPENKTTGPSFGQMLDSLNQTQNDSDALIQKLAAGEEVDLHQVMIATEQADISMRVALAIRDKLVESYREVMRMTV
jgi:flagellar hook-basal body complex protein FliE